MYTMTLRKHAESVFCVSHVLYHPVNCCVGDNMDLYMRHLFAKLLISIL